MTLNCSIVLLSSVIASILLAGCASDTPIEGTAVVPYPQAVTKAFYRDHKDAKITGVYDLGAKHAEGQVYRVIYERSGKPDAVLYDAEGNVVPAAKPRGG